MVAPLAGAWIEICRKLKFYVRMCVAPLAGAWIEITVESRKPASIYVAPLAGAWIEMFLRSFVRSFKASLPSRERGLKFLRFYEK